MKLGDWAYFLMLVLIIPACKSSENEIVRQTQLAENSVPAYDSIDWFKETHFEKLTPAEKREKFELISSFFNQEWIPTNASGGLIVAWKGQIIFEGYTGYSDWEKKTPIDANTPIHIASVSKVLTALAVLKLIQFHKLDPEAEVSSYLKGFPYENVKVVDLLTHRSGLPNYLSLSDDKQYWDNSKMMSNQDVLDLLITKKPPISFLAGSKFAYNNTNYLLLAMIIEKVTGLTYQKAMKQMVFDPLGMTHTFVMEFDKDANRVSKSYYRNGREWGYDHLDKTYGDKNIYSTPRDLLKMDIAMYSPNFLPKEIKEIAWKGYSYEKKGIKNYGFGIRMLEWDNGDKLLYHKGLWHGNRSTYVRDYKDEVCVIALGNRLNKSVYESMGLVSLFHQYSFPAPIPESKEDSLKLAQPDDEVLDSITLSKNDSKTEKSVSAEGGNNESENGGTD